MYSCAKQDKNVQTEGKTYHIQKSMKPKSLPKRFPTRGISPYENFIVSADEGGVGDNDWQIKII